MTAQGQPLGDQSKTRDGPPKAKSAAEHAGKDEREEGEEKETG